MVKLDTGNIKGKEKQKDLMPLKKGCSSKIRSFNISEMKASGRPLNQAIAASISFQKKQGCKVKPKKRK